MQFHSETESASIWYPIDPENNVLLDYCIINHKSDDLFLIIGTLAQKRSLWGTARSLDSATEFLREMLDSLNIPYCPKELW